MLSAEELWFILTTTAQQGESAEGGVATLTEEANAMTVVHDGMEHGYLAGLEQGQLDNEAANAMGDKEERP